MMNRSERFAIIILMLIYIVNGCISQKKQSLNSYRDLILEIVSDELPAYLDKIPLGSEKNFGFNNRDEYKEAVPADPFYLYTVRNNELIKTTGVIVPVKVNDDYRALVTVDSINNDIHIVDFGATNLAEEIQGVTLKYPELSFKGMLRIYSIYSDFIMMSDNGYNIYIPLLSGQKYLAEKGISYERGLSFNEILTLTGR